MLEAGDTLLLQGAPGFLRAHRNSPDFYLVSEIAGTETLRYDRAGIAIGILILMVLAASLGAYPISIAAFLAAGLLLATRSISGGSARRSVDWSILIVIGASFGIALAMQKTGAAEAVAGLIAFAAGSMGPVAALIVVYLTALLLAELLHHNAAVALMFPIAVETANLVGADPRRIRDGGGHRGLLRVRFARHLPDASDRLRPGRLPVHRFVRVGLPLNAVCAVIAIAMIPIHLALLSAPSGRPSSCPAGGASARHHEPNPPGEHSRHLLPPCGWWQGNENRGSSSWGPESGNCRLRLRFALLIESSSADRSEYGWFSLHIASEFLKIDLFLDWRRCPVGKMDANCSGIFGQKTHNAGSIIRLPPRTHKQPAPTWSDEFTLRIGWAPFSGAVSLLQSFESGCRKRRRTAQKIETGLLRAVSDPTGWNRIEESRVIYVKAQDKKVKASEENRGDTGRR